MGALMSLAMYLVNRLTWPVTVLRPPEARDSLGLSQSSAGIRFHTYYVHRADVPSGLVWLVDLCDPAAGDFWVRVYAHVIVT